MTGEVGEAIHSCRHPPPFHESVMNRSEAGDLTYAEGIYSCGTVLDLHQLRRVLTVIFFKVILPPSYARCFLLSRERHMHEMDITNTNIKIRRGHTE